MQSKIDQSNLPVVNPVPQAICLCIDATWFGNLLIMVFRSPELKKNLYAKIVTSETVEEYRSGIKYLINQGWKIKAIISDGKGLRQDFFGIPVQMCHFHQTKIITKYLTKNPILKANIDLRHIALQLSKTDKESLVGWLNDWYVNHGEFLKEKTLNPETGRYHFTHRRTRSAYFSLNRNLDYLFTFYDHLELNIPNTNNSMEGYFSYLKKKVNIHNGLREDRKIKLIFYLLFRRKQPQKKRNYAVFYTAKALLLDKGLISKTHTGTVRLFGENFIKTGIIEKKYGQWLSSLLQERTEADYDALREFDFEEASQAFRLAEDFTAGTKTLFEK